MSRGQRGLMRNLFLLFAAGAALAIPGYSQSEKPWQQLFNGKNLSGWKHLGPGHMTVENGLIQTHGGKGLLYWTAAKVDDCLVPVMYKMRDNNVSSCLFIPIPIQQPEESTPLH